MTDRQGVTELASATINAHGVKLTAAQGSVVTFSGGAIVNAANEGCLGGGGVDGAINRAGGPKLHEAREALPYVDARSGVRCFTGHATSTVAGELPCDYVIHAVGPNYRDYESIADADALLYRAYHSSVLEALALGVSDVAFCLLSAGIFRGRRSLKDVLRVGVLAASAAAASVGEESQLKEIFVVAFLPQEVEALTTVVNELLVDAEAPNATEALLRRLGPGVREMHQRAMGGASVPLEPPIGYSMAMAAAFAMPPAPPPPAGGDAMVD